MKALERATRVVHHCSLSGAFSGVVLSKYALTARTKIFLFVFFHDLSRYDARHELKQLKQKCSEQLSANAQTDKPCFLSA